MYEEFKLSNLSPFHTSLDSLKKIVESIKENCEKRRKLGLEPNQIFVIWDDIESGKYNKMMRQEDKDLR